MKPILERLWVFRAIAIVFLTIVPFGLRIAEAASIPEEVFEAPKIVAIENRKFSPKHDLTVDLALLPMDAFFRGLGAGLGYTYFFEPYFGWEIFKIHYVNSEETNLKKDLSLNFEAKPKNPLDPIAWTASTNLVYTPFYSKNLLFNNKLIHSTYNFTAGLGSVGFKSKETASTVGLGFNLRFFSSPLLSYRFDARLYNHFGKNKASDFIMFVGFGLVFEFGNNKAY